MNSKLIELAITQLEYYKNLAENRIAEFTEEQLLWQHSLHCNSIAVLIKHISSNMISRWTDFLTTDGEKQWRNRSDEFTNEIFSKESLIEIWNKGWECLFITLNSLSIDDLEKKVIINSKEIEVQETIIKNLAHYVYHIGQIISTSKMLNNE